jgi:hypothetical protein
MPIFSYISEHNNLTTKHGTRDVVKVTFDVGLLMAKA